jgi:hypothetical protein
VLDHRLFVGLLHSIPPMESPLRDSNSLLPTWQGS